MKSNIGLWIDHRKAVIVLETSSGEEINVIMSDADCQPVRLHGDGSTVLFQSLKSMAKDMTKHKCKPHMHHYYEEVIACIRHAEGLLIFGPGEAKNCLVKELESVMPGGFVINVEDADKMTNRQIAAHVRDHYQQECPVIPLH